MPPAEIDENDFRIENTRVTHVPSGAWFDFNSKTAAIVRESAEGEDDKSVIRLWAIRLWLQRLLDTLKARR